MVAIVGIGIALLIITGVLWMLLTRQIREKYAVLWLVLGVVLLVLGLFPGLLTAATAALGVELPVNLLFAAAITVLLGVTLHLSWELSQSEAEVRRLAEEVAILGARVDALDGAPTQRHQDSGSEDVDE
ncbi:DUF2304 domain-containing protein [Microbacterium sp. YJN-G]|uniref:DUF2304 domain-containing protein n=1 Tax=Microbacterium sp. YJN-G TaxID=2763257 RepID=UPI00187813E8|nr:DUF2304 domain-containing protein [Microbacterium sp. YJN-G]